MEYYQRGDLADWISRVAGRGEAINARNIWSIIDQLSLGLFRCHNGYNHPQDPVGPGNSDGIVVLHRDLKPENSMRPRLLIKLTKINIDIQYSSINLVL